MDWVLFTEIVLGVADVLPGSLYGPVNLTANYQKIVLSQTGAGSHLTHGVTPPTPLQKSAANDQLTGGCKSLAPLLQGGIGSVVQAMLQGYPRDQAVSGSHVRPPPCLGPFPAHPTSLTLPFS